MKVQRAKERRVRIEMLPLIDIVFLLLVFFIYAMLSMAVHRALPVILPMSTTAAVDKNPALSITAKSDGTVYVDKEEIPLKFLTSFLKEVAPGKVKAGVLLFADRDLSYQGLFEILDQIRKAGLRRISLQAEVKE